MQFSGGYEISLGCLLVRFPCRFECICNIQAAEYCGRPSFNHTSNDDGFRHVRNTQLSSTTSRPQSQVIFLGVHVTLFIPSVSRI
uniref:Protein AFR n=1 Tax=Solanum tuberosum TaxID=4113 RepID=M1BDJ7_SOLTU